MRHLIFLPSKSNFFFFLLFFEPLQWIFHFILFKDYSILLFSALCTYPKIFFVFLQFFCNFFFWFFGPVFEGLFRNSCRFFHWFFFLFQFFLNFLSFFHFFFIFLVLLEWSFISIPNWTTSTNCNNFCELRWKFWIFAFLSYFTFRCVEVMSISS